jgi:spectinomycin phosphotransferase
VRDLPEELETSPLIDSLADGWGFDVETIDYAAVGFGSYHWIATDFKGTRRFVTVDDLDHKPWLGETPESVFEGLRRSFDTAVALRDAGLDFVVAPIPTSRRETVRRTGSRYAVALFPFVEGQASPYGQYDTLDERAAVAAMLAELHLATPIVGRLARRIDLDVPGRGDLESGLRDVNQEWSGGPFSEPARQELGRHASDMAELLGLRDRLSRDVARRSVKWVVTHGEPHAANVMRTDQGRVLIDWDTVALAPPERDLWMVLDDTADEARIYADATGDLPDQVAVDFFRLAWDLADLAAFIRVLRSPHRHSEDTTKAYEGLTKIVTRRSMGGNLA